MSEERSKSSGLVPALVVAMLSLVTTLPLVVMGHNAGRAAWDSVVYHERFIRELSQDWPRFDCSNPLTATTPGYHLVLASLAAAGFGSEVILRSASALIAAVLCGGLACWLARRVSRLEAVLLAMPLVCSSYVIGSGAWLLPDNLAWLGVLGVLVCCLKRDTSWRMVAVASAVLVGLVLVRQIHIWAAGVIWLAAWLDAASDDRGVFADVPRRVRRAIVAALMTLPAFLALAWFVRLWGGLTPPRFQTDIAGANFATPAFILMQVAILSVGFAPWLAGSVLGSLRKRTGLMLLAAALGLLLAAFPVTTQSVEAGRFSGWWSLVGRAPVIAGHTSVVILALAPVGACVLAGALLGLPRRSAWILFGVFVAFTAAQTATINCWQRYHEPMLLILLAMIASMQPAERMGMWKVLRIPAVFVLCAVFGVIAFQSVRGYEVSPETPPSPEHRSPGDPWIDTE